MLLWSGQTVSAIGSSASQIAFPLLILFLTGSAAQAGIVGGLQLVPYVFLSLPVGALIDRWDRKRVMIAAESIRAINMASVPIVFAFGHLWVVQLYAVALVEGSAFVFFNIAEVACLPRVVAKEQLPGATAQNQMMYMFATFAGPSLGGFLYQAAGRAIPFLADAISYAASMVSLLFIKTEFQGVRPVSRQRLGPEIAEGLRWLWNQRVLRVTAIIMSLSTLVNAGAFLLFIVLARSLSVSPAGIGFILSIASIGGLAGALLAPRLQRRFSFGQLIIVTLWLQALLIPPIALAPSAPALTVCVVALFITFPIVSIVILSYRLALIPDELQGRVNSVFRLALFAPGPAGQVPAGIAIQTIGVRPAFFVMAGGNLLLAFAATLSTQIRRAPPIEHEAAA